MVNTVSHPAPRQTPRPTPFTGLAHPPHDSIAAWEQWSAGRDAWGLGLE